MLYLENYFYFVSDKIKILEYCSVIHLQGFTNNGKKHNKKKLSNFIFNYLQLIIKHFPIILVSIY